MYKINYGNRHLWLFTWLEVWVETLVAAFLHFLSEWKIVAASGIFLFFFPSLNPRVYRIRFGLMSKEGYDAPVISQDSSEEDIRAAFYQIQALIVNQKFVLAEKQVTLFLYL
jgi:hypothetical protein